MRTTSRLPASPVRRCAHPPRRSAQDALPAGGWRGPRLPFDWRPALGSLLAVAIGAATPALAGGFKIQDQSTRAMGMIDAFVAGADDASAIYYNPAGLTNVDGPEAIGNLYLAHGVTWASSDAGDETSDGRYYTVPSLYGATPLRDESRLVLGLGAYSPFGLGSRWPDHVTPDAYGRRITLAEIELANVNPTLAYRLTDTLAVGAGVDYFISRVKNRYIQIYPTPPAPPGSQGQVDMEARGDGYGFNLGTQWRCLETVQVGLTYRSPVQVHYTGDVDLDRYLGGPNLSYPAESDIDYPAVAAAAVSWRPVPRLRVELAAEWSQWSTRDTQTVTIDSPVPQTTTTQLDWRDSWVWMLGGEYRLTDRWTLRGGYGYNETPAPDESVDRTLPTGDTHAVSLGAGYQITPAASLDTACVLAYGTKRSLGNAANPPGTDYEAFSAYLSLGFRYRF